MIRRLLHIVAIVAMLTVGATAAFFIVSQTAWFKNWLRGYIVREANQYVNGTVSIERLGGNLFFGVEMENVALSMDGSQVVAIKDLGLDYNVFELIRRGLSVDGVRLNHLVIYLRRDGDGWSLSRLVKKQASEADRRGPARPIAIDAIGISDGAIVFESPVATSGIEVPKRVDHLDAKLSFKYEPVRYSIEVSHVSFRGSNPEMTLNALSGGVSVKDDTIYVDKLALRTRETSLSIDGAVQHYLTTPVLNLQVSSDKTSLPEIARIVPAVAGIRLQPSFNLKASGPFDQLHLEMNVQSAAGSFSGTVLADLLAPGQSAVGTVSVRHLDLSALLDDPKRKTDITADAQVNLHGEALSNVSRLQGDIELDAPRIVAAGYVAERLHAKATFAGRRVQVTEGRVAAYGATATVEGRVVLPDPTAKNGATDFDLHGAASHVDLRQLPRSLGVPPAATDINAAYHGVGSFAAGSNQTSVDLQFETSTIAGAGIARGDTARVTVAGDDVSYAADATVADLDLQRLGREFRVPALDAAGYASRINGHVTAAGRGTSPAGLELTARGTLTDSTVLGGQVPHLDFDVAASHDAAHVKASGTFFGFDPAAIAGKPQLKGSLAGSVRIDATATHVSSGVTTDSVEADATITLGPSTIGSLTLTNGSIDGTYRDSIGEVRALELVGHDVHLTAKGTLALNDTGASNLAVHADSTDLSAVGQLIDAPLGGIARVDATVTGNRRELQATGTVGGGEVVYGTVNALTIGGDFTANLPDLTPAQATVVADSHATFVTVAGQNINELDAKTTYRDQRLEFDATAKQPRRTASLAGEALLHPDHQEVHLQRLSLQAQGQTWQLAPGESATVNYAREGAVTVDHVTLANGPQRIAADGTFGRPGETLKVTLTNVDVAGVNALLLRPPQFTGTLTASATVAGTTPAPTVDATFEVTKGGFQQFRYDSFGGTARYAGAGVTLDTKLQQNPSTFLTAKGYVPTALFTGGASGDSASAAPADRIDLHIVSTPIELGLIEGFTNAVTKVTGTLQAKIDLGGSAADPRPTGTVAVANGAFTIAETGVPYNHLTGQIDLQPDRIHIGTVSILDNQQNALSLTGDLAVHEGQIGGVQLAITARDFKVIDNKIGNVRIDSDMQIAGELSAPRIEGDLAINTGRLDLDQILARMNDSAYATEQVAYASDQAKTAASPFDALQMYVHLTVPNDLAVKANDLQAPGAPIGLGALNLTMGGDVYVSKSPWDQVRLIGRVNTVRGTYDFQGRRFDILRDGNVRFDGADQLDPALDVRTQRLIQGVTANVNIRGTLSNPQVELTSTPPLEQADILALIVFNQPINQLGEGQQTSLAARAQQLATGAVAGELAQSLSRALRLDTLEINTAPDTGAAAQVTVGQQVGANLYVKVEQDVGNSNLTNFILEYELTKWLRLRTNVLQGSPGTQQLFQRSQSSGVDLLFFFSY